MTIVINKKSQSHTWPAQVIEDHVVTWLAEQSGMVDIRTLGLDG